MRRLVALVALLAVASVVSGSTARRRPIAVGGDPFSPSWSSENFEVTAADTCTEEVTLGAPSGTTSASCVATGLAGSEAMEFSEARQAYAADTGHVPQDTTTDRTTGVMQLRFLFRIDTMGSGATNDSFIRGYDNSSQNGLRVFFNSNTDKVAINCDGTGGGESGGALSAGTLYYVVITYNIDTAVGTLYVSSAGYSKNSGDIHSSCDGADGTSTMDKFRFYRANIDTYRIDDFGWGPDA